MPSIITHSYFIMDVYDKLPINRKKFLIDQKDNLIISSQSMDILSYYLSYNLRKAKKVHYFSRIFHTRKTDDYIITLINYIKYNSYMHDPNIMSFLYGIISHYILDSTINPYMIYKTNCLYKNSNSKKYILENLIDQYMIRIRENMQPNKYKFYKHIHPCKYNNSLADVINFTFKEVYNISKMDDVLYSSIKNTKYIFRYLRYDYFGIKSRLYSIIDFVNPNKEHKISFLSYNIKNTYFNDYLNLTHRTWHYPTTKSKKYNYSFIDLYLISLNNTINIIREIDLYIYKDKKTDLNKLIKNKSYLTKIKCEKNNAL